MQRDGRSGGGAERGACAVSEIDGDILDDLPGAPEDAATDAVNATSLPAVGLVVVTVSVTAGCGLGLTVTDIDAGVTVPKVSVTVPVTI